MAVASLELVLTVFLAIMLVAQILSLKAKVPYTMILVFIGVGVAAVATLPLAGSNAITDAISYVIDQMSSFYTGLVGGGLFVGIVVPPLIFEAMLHIRAPDLRAVIRPSIVLATVGVVIATLVGGTILWELSGLPLSISLLFGAIIAPTDVVTVLEVTRRLNVPSRLAVLMNTEAAFNDATAIIVFTIVLSSLSLPRLPIATALFSFLFSIAGGAVVGAAVAYLASWIHSITHDKIAQLILTISAVYGSYVFASGIGASGLISVAVVGLYFGNVTIKSKMLIETQDTILTFWEVAAFVGNSVAFLLIGFETNLVTFGESIVFILFAYMAVIMARAASVYPILAIFNQLGENLPFTWSNVAMFGGVRGALSIALAASLSASAILSDSDVHIITSMVLGVAFLSIVIQTPILSQYAKKRLGEQETLDSK
ncbi:MAG: cation:proton antiporter [Nitrososphaerota archaeon]|nr:cation:proton antiporter [Nitrososphaerota archaeon]